MRKHRFGSEKSPIKLNPDGSPCLASDLRATEKQQMNLKRFMKPLDRRERHKEQVDQLPKFAVKHPKPFITQLKVKMPLPKYSASIFGGDAYEQPSLKFEPGSMSFAKSRANFRIPTRNKGIRSMASFCDILTQERKQFVNEHQEL